MFTWSSSARPARLAAVAALSLSVFAARVHDGRAVVLGMAFSAMAMMLVIHALATPGALVAENGLVQVAGALNLPAGAVILAASALPAVTRPSNVRALLVLDACRGGARWSRGGRAVGGAERPGDPEAPATLPRSCSPAARYLRFAGVRAGAPTCSRDAHRICS